MSGLLKPFMPKAPDTRVVERQIEVQREETAKQQEAVQEERRDLAEQEAAKRKARSRGGSRMLLADVRFNPEAGIQTLGSDIMKGV